MNTLINLPKNIKIILWNKNKAKNKKIVLLYKKKYIKLLFNNNIFIDKWCNAIIFLKKHNNKLNLKLEKKIYSFLNSLNLFYFNKIKFKGKGFRIKFFKKIKLIKFYFGKSHKTFLILKKIKRKKITKYKFIIYSINFNKLKNISYIINNIKKLNMYTLRGLRSSRQIIFKRKGKKGTYI